MDICRANQGDIDCIVPGMLMPDQNSGETYDKLRQINNNINVRLSSGYSLNGQATEILNRAAMASSKNLSI